MLQVRITCQTDSAGLDECRQSRIFFKTIFGQRHAEGFLGEPSAKSSWEMLWLETTREKSNCL